MSQNRFRLCVIASASLLGFLNGCGESHQTVEWYQAHKVERDAKLQWCGGDASRVSEVDCLNAKKAMHRTMISGPSAAETFHFNADAVKQNESK